MRRVHSPAWVSVYAVAPVSSQRGSLPVAGEFAQLWYQFGFIGKNEQFARCGSYHFFLQQSAATAFYQLQAWVYFIGAIDGDVNRSNVVQFGQGNIMFGAEGGRFFRSGNSAEEQSFFNQVSAR